MQLFDRRRHISETVDFLVFVSLHFVSQRNRRGQLRSSRGDSLFFLVSSSLVSEGREQAAVADEMDTIFSRWSSIAGRDFSGYPQVNSEIAAQQEPTNLWYLLHPP